jgi:hypothetical protein
LKHFPALPVIFHESGDSDMKTPFPRHSCRFNFGLFYKGLVREVSKLLAHTEESGTDLQASLEAVLAAYLILLASRQRFLY